MSHEEHELRDLLVRNRGRLGRILAVYKIPAHEAEDVIQDALVDLLRQPHTTDYLDLRLFLAVKKRSRTHWQRRTPADLIPGPASGNIANHPAPSTAEHLPGGHLRLLAQRLFSLRSYTSVIEPTLSDLAEEHALALAEQGPWSARYVRLRGYWSFWVAVTAHLVAALGGKFSKLWARSRE